MRIGKKYIAIPIIAALIVCTSCSQYACPSYESYSYGTDRPNYAAMKKKQSKRHKAPKPVRRAEM